MSLKAESTICREIAALRRRMAAKDDTSEEYVRLNERWQTLLWVTTQRAGWRPSTWEKGTER